MRFFKSKQTETAVQTAPKDSFYAHPFSSLSSYTPLGNGEYSLYASLREAIPIIDAAICKTIRLVGDFKVKCPSKSVETALNLFLKSVKVNATGAGIGCFLSAYLDQMLTYGTAVGEIVLDNKGANIAALYNANLNDIALKKGNSPLSMQIYTNTVQCNTPVKYPELIAVTALNPQPGEIKGTSILKGLPFISNILLKIINTVGVNWERVGNVRFAVTYKPTDSGASVNQKRAVQLADQWSKAMRDKTTVNDFVAVGDVDIKVIGADNQILDCQVPARLMLEQIVSKLCIPPFLLGLNWSSTERMSSQQADILTSELEYYRNILNPVIEKICSMWLRLNGCDDDCTIEWSNINLQDEVELANARLLNAQAEQIKKQNELSEVKE